MNAVYSEVVNMVITVEGAVTDCLRRLDLALVLGPVRVCSKYESRAQNEVLRFSSFIQKE